MSLESFGFKRITSAVNKKSSAKKEELETDESENSKDSSKSPIVRRAQETSMVGKKRVTAVPSNAKSSTAVPLIQAKLQVPLQVQSPYFSGALATTIPQATSAALSFIIEKPPASSSLNEEAVDAKPNRKKRHAASSSETSECKMADVITSQPSESAAIPASDLIPQPARKRRKAGAAASAATVVDDDSNPVIPTEYASSRPRRSVAQRATTYREKTESDIEEEDVVEDKPKVSKPVASYAESRPANVTSASSERSRVAAELLNDFGPWTTRPDPDVLYPILPSPARFPPPRSFSSVSLAVHPGPMNPSYHVRPFNLLLSLRAREMSIAGHRRMDGGMTPAVAVKQQIKRPEAITCTTNQPTSSYSVAFSSLPSLYHSSLRTINFDQLGFSSFPRALINRTATYSRDLREQSLPCLVKNRFDVGAGGGLTASQFKGYSMKFSTRGELIGLAGYAGVVKLFHSHAEQESVCEDTSQLMSPFEADYMKPICTFVAHSRWISSLRFIDPSLGHANSFITTADDSHMRLWNAEAVVMENPVREGLDTVYQPKAISSRQPHGEFGIYNMDAFSDRVTSCSKDGSVAVSQLTPFDISAPIVRLADYHSNQVVKDVSHRDLNVLASGGNDRSVNVFDIRSSNNPNAIRFEQLHLHPVTTVAWNPSNPYQLMSSSLDCRIQLLDVRVSDRGPIHTLAQHFPRAVTRAPSVFRPIYMHQGNFILTASTSNSLFLYSSTTGELLRTWDVGFSSSQLASFDDPATGQSSFVTYCKRLLHRMTLKFRST